MLQKGTLGCTLIPPSAVPVVASQSTSLKPVSHRDKLSTAAQKAFQAPSPLLPAHAAQHEAAPREPRHCRPSLRPVPISAGPARPSAAHGPAGRPRTTACPGPRSSHAAASGAAPRTERSPDAASPRTGVPAQRGPARPGGAGRGLHAALRPPGPPAPGPLLRAPPRPHLEVSGGAAGGARRGADLVLARDQRVAVDLLPQALPRLAGQLERDGPRRARQKQQRQQRGQPEAGAAGRRQRHGGGSGCDEPASATRDRAAACVTAEARGAGRGRGPAAVGVRICPARVR